MRVRFRCPVRRNDWRSANYCLPDFLFDRSPGNKNQTRTHAYCFNFPASHGLTNQSTEWEILPLADFLVLVSGLHLLVSRRVFSQDVSLFAFRLSTLVIIWFTHPLHVPFSYRHATVNDRIRMFPNSLLATMRDVNCRLTFLTLLLYSLGLLAGLVTLLEAQSAWPRVGIRVAFRPLTLYVSARRGATGCCVSRCETWI